MRVRNSQLRHFGIQTESDYLLPVSTPTPIYQDGKAPIYADNIQHPEFLLHLPWWAYAGAGLVVVSLATGIWRAVRR